MRVEINKNEEFEFAGVAAEKLAPNVVHHKSLKMIVRSLVNVNQYIHLRSFRHLSAQACQYIQFS